MFINGCCWGRKVTHVPQVFIFIPCGVCDIICHRTISISIYQYLCYWLLSIFHAYYLVSTQYLSLYLFLLAVYLEVQVTAVGHSGYVFINYAYLDV